MDQELTYDTAFTELKEIARQIENESIPVDILTEKVKRASELLLFCQDRLRKTEVEVNQIIRSLDLPEATGE
jgi:exodeoxyribonuclease VII small subunit